MNNTFNIQRFGLLLKRQWLEFSKIYLIILGVALGIMITFYSFGLWDQIMDGEAFQDNDLRFREPLFLIFGFIFITVIASSYFAHLGQKPKAIVDLLIPASTFEKFLGGVFFTGFLSALSFILLFYITDLAFVMKLKALNPEALESDKLVYFFTRNNPNLFWPAYLIPFFITSIFLLGSIYFNRFHYIKTAISVMIFSGIWAYIMFKLGEGLFKGRIPIESNQPPAILNSKNSVELLVALLITVLTVIFWAITFRRLKEKEV